LRTQEEITALFKKYIRSQCTEEELYAVSELLCTEEYELLFKDLISAELEEPIQEEFKDLTVVKEALAETKKNIILQVNEAGSQQSGRYRITRFKFAAAAMLLLCAGIAVFFYISKQAIPTNERYSGTDVQPGGHKAVLTLADGSKIVLDEHIKGDLTNQAGIKVTKTEDGKLVYKVQEGQQGEKVAGLTNSISTPRGGQYQVNLPDGTRVWLNAESVLTFPLSFANLKERRVELQGEAYFEVAKVIIKDQGIKGREQGTGTKFKRMPFVVKSDKQTVEVIGTHFNINTYDQETKTTLLEGSVKVLPLNGPETDQKILKPGQQAQVSRDVHLIHVIQVDPQTEIAWKNGLFFFENEPIERIMKEIARWYDIEVVYQANVSDKTVWGSVTRYANVSKVLSIIELTGGVHFKVEGRRVIVQK
jgi:transmembrane sensor